MLSIVSFKWRPHPGYRSQFGPETVNVLKRMVARHYQKPHRFICITDDSHGIDADVEVLPLWQDHSNLSNPHGVKHPSCYRRLRMFSPQIAELVGSRFVMLDLDAVITSDVSPLWDRPEDFVIWGDTNPKTPYNGSMMLMTAGARKHVWERFDPQQSPRQAVRAGFFGSDQGWISYVLGKGEAKWTQSDGVYSWRNHVIPNRGQLPPGARIVLFHGGTDPWSDKAQRYEWVKRHWQ